MGSYRNWALRDGSLLIEKFTGTFGVNEILSADKSLLHKAPKGADIRNLADLRDASLSELKMNEITQVIDNIKANSPGFRSYRLALVFDMSSENDMDKAHQYLYEAANRLNVLAKLFYDMEIAMSWLKINNGEKAEIEQLLENHIQPTS